MCNYKVSDSIGIRVGLLSTFMRRLKESSCESLQLIAHGASRLMEPLHPHSGLSLISSCVKVEAIHTFRMRVSGSEKGEDGGQEVAERGNC